MFSKKILIMVFLGIILLGIFLVYTTFNETPKPLELELEQKEKWGIYSLNLRNNETRLLYSSNETISRIKLNNAGDKLVFSQQYNNIGNCTKKGTPINLCEEICMIQSDGLGFTRLTNNNYWDLFPNWSKDDSHIFFLSFRETLDIFKMKSNGENVEKFYDSGFHDSDLSCLDGRIVFTKESKIWMINEDGSNLNQITNPPRAQEWGNAVLPFGDYDPHLSPDGMNIIFERLVDDLTTHGNYDIFVVNTNTLKENALTSTGYTQGLPVWSHSGQKIVFLVGAIGDQGSYDIYIMNSDGSNNHNITPEYFPNNFLCHDPIFSKNDNEIFFIGEWYLE